MINAYITESTLHYIAGFLARYEDKYQTKHHLTAMKEIRDVSNKLLETLEKPAQLSIIRHRLKEK